MVTYPLTFPTVEIQNANFRLTRATAKTVSPFTFREQVSLHQGERWEGDVSFKPVRQADASKIQSFLLNLQGEYGTFLYGDPNYLALGARGLASGSPLVDGASQTGNTLAIKNLGNNLTGWLLAGDYIQIGTATASRLHQLTADADTDGLGKTTLEFFPNIRTSPADGAAIIASGAMGLFRAAGNNAEWTIGENNIYGFSLSFMEAIGE